MNEKFALLTYLFAVGVRAGSFRRRWNLPLVHGPDYFYHMQVAKGFYEGAGRGLLHRYRALLLWPYAAEAAVLVMLVLRDNYNSLPTLCLVGILSAVLNQRLSLALVMRSAKKFEDKEVDPAPAAVTFSLNPRRLADYTHPVFEIVLGNIATITLIVLAQMRAAMGPPLVMLYLQIGLLMLKKAIVDWRSAAPLENSEIYLEVRERRRKLLLFCCDFYRGAIGFLMIKQVVLQFISFESVRWALQSFYLAVSIACVWFAIVKTNELYALYRKTKPTLSRKRRLAIPDPDGFVAGGFLYFDSDNPAFFVQGPRSVAINAGNHRLLLAATYLLGLLLLSTWANKANAATASNQDMRQVSTPALEWSSPLRAESGKK
jgi:hypothetical protein